MTAIWLCRCYRHCSLAMRDHGSSTPGQLPLDFFSNAIMAHASQHVLHRDVVTATEGQASKEVLQQLHASKRRVPVVNSEGQLVSFWTCFLESSPALVCIGVVK